MEIKPKPRVNYNYVHGEVERALELDLCCPICQRPLEQPIELDCGHLMCASCFVSVKEDARDMKLACPECQYSINVTTVRMVKLVSLLAVLGDLKVVCPNTKCKLIVNRSDLARHLDVCPLPLAQLVAKS